MFRSGSMCGQHRQCAGGKARRDARLFGVILNQVHDRMNTAVHRSSVIVFITEILPKRMLLILGDVKRMFNQLVYALVFRRRDRNDRYAEQRLHPVDIDKALIADHLVHHVQCKDHRNIHLQQLHRQIQIPFDIGRVQNVDDRLRLFFQHKIPGDDFLTAVGRHGVNARKVGHIGLGMSFDRAVFPVNRNARKVSDVLIGASQLIKKGGFSAVLVTHQRKSQCRSFRKRVSVIL